MLRGTAECADHVHRASRLSARGPGSVRPGRRARRLRCRLCRPHEGPALARHRAEGAAGPHQPRASRRVRLRGEHGRRRGHSHPDSRHVPAEGGLVHAAARRLVRRGSRVPAAPGERSRRDQGADWTDRRGRRRDAARMARRAERQQPARRERGGDAAGVPAGVRRVADADRPIASRRSGSSASCT